jgi:hypothetical protein
LETISPSSKATRGHLALSVSLNQRRLQCGIPSTSDDNAFFAVVFSREISGKNLDHLFTSISLQSFHHYSVRMAKNSPFPPRTLTPLHDVTIPEKMMTAQNFQPIPRPKSLQDMKRKSVRKISYV